MDFIAKTRPILLPSQQFVSPKEEPLINEVQIDRMQTAHSLGSLVRSGTQLQNRLTWVRLLNDG
jgi:hypothetical protein